MSRWNKNETRYSEASQHYDLDYFIDQTRDGELRGLINKWKFEPYLRPGLDILDFGCGDGALLKALGGRNGVEVNPHSREAAKARGFRIEEAIGDYSDASMDLIVSNHCLEHVENPLAVVREMRRVIRNDGVLVLVVPCHGADFPYRSNDRDYHLFSWSAANIGNMVKIAGFHIVEAHELLHRWPPKWRAIINLFGMGAFHLASHLWARLDRSSSQVICVAKPAIPD